MASCQQYSTPTCPNFCTSLVVGSTYFAAKMSPGFGAPSVAEFSFQLSGTSFFTQSSCNNPRDNQQPAGAPRSTAYLPPKALQVVNVGMVFHFSCKSTVL